MVEQNGVLHSTVALRVVSGLRRRFGTQSSLTLRSFVPDGEGCHSSWVCSDNQTSAVSTWLDGYQQIKVSDKITIKCWWTFLWVWLSWIRCDRCVWTTWTDGLRLAVIPNSQNDILFCLINIALVRSKNIWESKAHINSRISVLFCCRPVLQNDKFLPWSAAYTGYTLNQASYLEVSKRGWDWSGVLRR